MAFFSASSGNLMDFSGSLESSFRCIGLAERLRSLVSFLFKISSFFNSISSAGMPVSDSCADSNRAHSSSMKIFAFFPLRNPVR